MAKFTPVPPGRFYRPSFRIPVKRLPERWGIRYNSGMEGTPFQPGDWLSIWREEVGQNSVIVSFEPEEENRLSFIDEVSANYVVEKLLVEGITTTIQKIPASPKIEEAPRSEERRRKESKIEFLDEVTDYRCMPLGTKVGRGVTGVCPVCNENALVEETYPKRFFIHAVVQGRNSGGEVAIDEDSCPGSEQRMDQDEPPEKALSAKP
jgi:hypothetical protein